MNDEKIDVIEKKVVKTDVDAKNGQSKCPKCGATDISVNTKSGLLRCNFCRHEFAEKKLEGMQQDISKLEGEIIGSGAQDIVADTNDVVTLKCSSCGAEVVVDTASVLQARCHWCRNVLSINEQIPNGSIPDVILAFNVTKEQAQKNIADFVGKRQFFAHPQFKKEFTTENIMGVYFPYMLVDFNAHASLSGEGEHQTREYTVGNDEHKTTYYDADAYHVERDFDIIIEGLSIESSSDKLDNTSKSKTNNIINSIMPFDVENAVKYDSNYLSGFTSEKRDTNIEMLKELANTQSKDIARFAANDSLTFYDRGVAWSSEKLDVKGQQWKAAYLPVWLYSYQQVKGNKKILHYVAVNARTQETMGSVPIHMPKLIGISSLVEIIGLLGMIFVDWEYDWLFLLLGVIYFIIYYSKYRNSGARHNYEIETKNKISNMQKKDDFIESRKKLRNRYITGVNNTKVNGTSIGKDRLSQLKDSLKL